MCDCRAFAVGDQPLVYLTAARARLRADNGLRARAVAEMSGNWSRYAPFIEDRLHANYLAKMALSGEYAGEPELIALSKVWGVTIHVWGAVSTFVISSPDAPASLPTVHLANRDAGNYRDHYWAVDFAEK